MKIGDIIETSRPPVEVFGTPNSAKVALVSVTICLIVLPHADGQLPATYHFALYDVPGARATELNGINDRGDFVGIYVTPDNIRRGFVRSADGSTLTTVVAPDGGSGSPVINSIGQTAFTSVTSSAPGFGFAFDNTVLYLRGANQQYRILATFSGGDGITTGINDRGQVIGYLVTKGPDIPFVLNPDGTPAAIKLNAVRNYGINNASQVLRINNNQSRPFDAVAFIDNPDGTPSGRRLDLPNNVGNAAMSNNGLITGTFENADPIHSFIGDPNTNLYSTLDVPGYEGQTRANGVNDFGVVVGAVGDASSTITHGFIATPVLTAPVLAPGGIMNAASYYNGSISPCEVVVLFGTGLGVPVLTLSTVDAAGLVATNILGTRVLFDGIPAPLLYASSGVVSAVVPYEETGAVARIQVEYSGIRSDVVTVPVTPSVPGIFSLDGSGRGPGVIFNQDNSINTALNPAKRGDIVFFYATGFGQTIPAGTTGAITGTTLTDSVLQQPLPITVMFENTKGLITYDGPAPAIIAGVSQVNVVVPKDAPFGATVPLSVQVGNATSQAGLTVALK